jgi:hypothetical protein
MQEGREYLPFSCKSVGIALGGDEAANRDRGENERKKMVM